MNWHAAQVGFVGAVLILTALTVYAGVYILSTVGWSDRWAVRRGHPERQSTRGT